MNTSFAEKIASLSHEHTPINYALLFLIVLTLLAFPVVSTILFPFYVRVSRKNRKRDRETAIFPFINYFYWVTCLTETFLYLAICLILVNWVCLPPLQIRYWLVVWTVYMLVKPTIALMLNILTALMALHRSLLYFFPKFQEAMTPTWKTAQRLIWALHCLLFYLVLRSANFQTVSRENDYWNRKMLIFQFSLYGFVLLSVFPYFIMILRIRKLTHLFSKAHSKPDHYIKLQILIIFIAKLLMVPLLLSTTITEDPNSIRNFYAPMFMKNLMCETAMASATIQISYLLNNKINLDTLKTSCCWCKKTRVEPFSSTDHNNNL